MPSHISARLARTRSDVTPRNARTALVSLPTVAALAWLACLGACADVPRAFGPTPAAARSSVNGLFGGFAHRFTNVERSPRYARAREMLGKYALTPSDVYNDSTVWTAIGSDGTRTLFGDASFTNGRYVFTNVPTSTPLDVAGDGRHIMRLHKAGGDVYDWFAGADFAAGSITAGDVDAVIGTWLRSVEGRSPDALRTSYRTAFPRSTATLGRLFSLDSLVTTPLAGGATDIVLGIRITPEGIKSTYPRYASYVDRYIRKGRMHFTLADARGRWIKTSAADGYVRMHLRERNGAFAPIDGPMRAMPDTLSLTLDATAKIRIFTIGVEHLVGEWVNVHTAHERGWAMRFTREPGWVLPPLAGTLLHSPLRRPFIGGGTTFRITVRDTPGAQTIIGRRTTTAVEESAVLRFVGRLSGTAMGDFVSNAEEEENAFNAAVFEALRADALSHL